VLLAGQIGYEPVVTAQEQPPPQRSRFRGAGPRVVLVLASLLLTLGAIELAARILYQEPWYVELLDTQRRALDHRYTLNADTLRDRDYPSPKPPDHRRVLILGDSFTFGMGVFDDAAVFPEVLERDLNRAIELPGVRQIDVLNAGKPGSLTDGWIKVYKTIAPKFDPDVLLLVFFLRDGTKLQFIAEFFRQVRKDFARHKDDRPLYDLSYLYRHYRDGQDRLKISQDYTESFHAAYFGDESQTAEWRAAQDNLRKLKKLAERRGATIGLVVFPILVELNENYPFAEICDLLVEYGDGNGFAVRNLLDDYRGHHGPDLWVSGFDQHPNEYGHALAAQALLPFVRRLLAESEGSERNGP
jgi:hypothetical protein